MNVVSLFNGMNTGRQALENVGIKVNKYYSSEIKPYAIELTQHHFPDTIQVGDVTKWKEWEIDWSSIDLILSGSPCQDLSAAGKRAGINGKKSSLFFVFVEILEHVKSLNPNVLFLQENVGSASKLDVGIMSRALGVYPVRINSSLLTAQLRDRYYWSNIRTKETMFDVVTDIPQPKDKGIMFKDIITSGYTERDKANALLQGDYKQFIKDEFKQSGYLKSRIEKGKQPPNLIYEENNELRVKTNTKQGYDVVTENDCIDLTFPTSTTRRGRVTKGKSPCLMESNNNLYSYKDGIVRTVNQVEMERLQGFHSKEIFCIFVLCKEKIIEFVDAVEKNQKLQIVVQNVLQCQNEKELLEFVSCAKKNTKQKNQQTKHIAVQNAYTQIQNLCEKHKEKIQNPSKKNLNVDNVAKNILYHNQELEEDFVTSNAFINITQEKTTMLGKEELLHCDNLYTKQMNGNKPLKMCGKEIMQLVEDVVKNSVIKKDKNFTSITSYRLSQNTIEQMLIIYYWYAKNAIIGSTHQKTKTEILYLNVRINECYTSMLSKAKAGSLLGDGWTLPVIEHIFKFIKK